MRAEKAARLGLKKETNKLKDAGVHPHNGREVASGAVTLESERGRPTPL